MPDMLFDASTLDRSVSLFSHGFAPAPMYPVSAVSVSDIAVPLYPSGTSDILSGYVLVYIYPPPFMLSSISATVIIVSTALARLSER